MKINKLSLAIGLILFGLVSIFLRFYGLENSPSSLGFDEAGLGYNSYSLLKTGRDEWGTRLPLSLRSFNDYKPALYAYLDIPFIKMFGLNQASTRMTSAFWGAISAIFTLLIIRRITKSNWIWSILAATIVTLSPWRLHFSRVALETNVSSAFFTIMVWFLLSKKRQTVATIGTIIFGLLSIYTYHSARVAVPALLFLYATDPLGQSIRNIWSNKKVIFSNLLSIFIIFLLSLPIFFANGLSILTRFNQTNLFSKFYPFAPTEVVGNISPWLSVTNNPAYYLLAHIFGRIVAYISPHNLTETIYPWVTKSAMVIVDNGMLGFLGTIFFIVGTYVVLSKLTSNKYIRALIYWIIAGALPAAVTWEWFHPFRSLNLFPALDIIAAFGILFVVEKTLSTRLIWRKIIILVCIFGFSFTAILFNWLNELNYSVWINNGEFQPGGFREGATMLMSLADKYPVIYIDTPQAQSYIFFLLYGKIDPDIIQNTNRNYQKLDGFPSEVFNFGKFIYKKFNWPTEKSNHNYIFYTQSEIKENEFEGVAGAKLYKVYDPFGRWTASIVTKD